jgi:hypothetical protein
MLSPEIVNYRDEIIGFNNEELHNLYFSTNINTNAQIKEDAMQMGLWHAWVKRGMWQRQKEKRPLGRLVWIGLIWLRIGTSGVLL